MLNQAKSEKRITINNDKSVAFRNKTENATNVTYKVLILGESRIGKTSILKRLDKNEFKETTMSTVGIDFVNVFYQIDNVNVKLQIWDTAGQERFRTITRNQLRNSKGIVLVYDITDKESFEQIEYWISLLEQMNLYTEIMYLIGNKLDLNNQRKVQYQDGQKLAFRNSIKFFETSAKTGENLTNIFQQLANDILENNDFNKIMKYKISSGCYKSFPFDYSKEAVVYLPKDEPAKKPKSKNPFKLKNKKPSKQKPEPSKSNDAFEKYMNQVKEAEKKSSKRSSIVSKSKLKRKMFNKSNSTAKNGCCTIM